MLIHYALGAIRLFVGLAAADSQATSLSPDPHPLRQDLFVVSRGDDRAKRYQLYLMDDQGRKKLLYGDPVLSCFNHFCSYREKRPTQ